MQAFMGDDIVEFAINCRVKRFRTTRPILTKEDLISTVHFYKRDYSELHINFNGDPDPQVRWVGIQLKPSYLDDDPILIIITCHKAIHMNDLFLLHAFLRFYRLPRAAGYEMVRLSARRNNMEAIDILVNFGYSVNRPRGLDTTVPAPVHYAMRLQNCNMLKYLVNAGADINARFDGAEEDYGDNSSFFGRQEVRFC